MSKRKHRPSPIPNNSINQPNAASFLQNRSVSESWSVKGKPEYSLQNKMIEFLQLPEFHELRDSAKQQYLSFFPSFQENEDEIFLYIEWVIRDYRPSGGNRITDEFEIRFGKCLPPVELELLTLGKRLCCWRLLEVREFLPSDRVLVRDLLSEEEWVVDCPDLCTLGLPWMVIFARPFPKEHGVGFSIMISLLPPNKMMDIRTFSLALLNSWRQTNPNSDIHDFYRDRSLLLRREFLRLRAEADRPAKMRTPEGHLLIPMAAEFAVHDVQNTKVLLDNAEEFERLPEAPEEPGAIQYVWYLRGRSRLPSKPVLNPTESNLSLGSDTVFDINYPGKPPILGWLSLWDNRILLKCYSQERLFSGKVLLGELIGGEVILHKRDFVINLHEEVEKHKSFSPSGSIPPREFINISVDLQNQFTSQWLEESIPALRGLTPRQAATMPDGRVLLEEILKTMEFQYSKQPITLIPPMDVTRIRKELGMEKK
jgi:hypothetical protein